MRLLATQGKPYWYGLIKLCLIAAAEEKCPEEKNLCKCQPFGKNNFSKCWGQRSNIHSQKNKADDFVWFSLVFDESADAPITV